MLGLSTGIYCVGVCLVFLMPYLLVEGKQKIFENLKKILSFMLGRFMAYITFAFLAGLLGSSYQNIFTPRFSNACLVAASLLMLAYALTHQFKHSGFCAPFINRFSLMRMPLFLGVLTGLNPCPPFLVGTARLWTLHSVWGGVVLFIAFFIGTSVYITPLIFIPYLNRNERIRQIGLMVALLSGVWFLFVGISGLIR